MLILIGGCQTEVQSRKNVPRSKARLNVCSVDQVSKVLPEVQPEVLARQYTWSEANNGPVRLYETTPGEPSKHYTVKEHVYMANKLYSRQLVVSKDGDLVENKNNEKGLNYGQSVLWASKIKDYEELVQKINNDEASLRSEQADQIIILTNIERLRVKLNGVYNNNEFPEAREEINKISLLLGGQNGTEVIYDSLWKWRVKNNQQPHPDNSRDYSPDERMFHVRLLGGPRHLLNDQLINPKTAQQNMAHAGFTLFGIRHSVEGLRTLLGLSNDLDAIQTASNEYSIDLLSEVIYEAQSEVPFNLDATQTASNEYLVNQVSEVQSEVQPEPEQVVPTSRFKLGETVVGHGHRKGVVVWIGNGYVSVRLENNETFAYTERLLANANGRLDKEPEPYEP